VKWKKAKISFLSVTEN